MRKEKTLLLDEIKEKIEKSNSMIVAKYESITAQETWTLRSLLNKSNADMEVVKKRIFLKALQLCGYKYDLKNLSGNIAVFFTNTNPINTAKVIFDFHQETNKLEVLRGEIEGSSYLKDDMEMLSKLPSLDILRASFLGLLEAPMAETLSVMEKALTSVFFALEEKKKLEEKK